MADVIFYSTGEIFWVNDPPGNRQHIVVPIKFAPVPSDYLFTYAMAAQTLSDAGHNVLGAFGRQRWEVRERKGPDPEILALGDISHPESTVLILIATDSDSRANGGSDTHARIPFSEDEKAAFNKFRARGGGVYVTWDHCQLGYESLKELGLHEPIIAEADEPLRPNVFHSHDSTGSARVETTGWVRRKCATPEEPNKICIEETQVLVSNGPPAGFLQKIVPANLLRKIATNPHPIFNGVGGGDGIWIPAHSHEGKLKIKASLLGFDETQLPEGVKALAVHVPLVETTFISFAVMAYKDAQWEIDESGQQRFKEGAVIWDTSFHHLNDINWSSTGKVPWDNLAPFSAEALWVGQFPPEVFESRLSNGMKRLLPNAVKWLANDLPGSPSQHAESAISKGSSNYSFMTDAIKEEFQEKANQLGEPESNYPSDDELSTASPG
jgi:hypothetical protein